MLLSHVSVKEEHGFSATCRIQVLFLRGVLKPIEISECIIDFPIKAVSFLDTFYTIL